MPQPIAEHAWVLWMLVGLVGAMWTVLLIIASSLLGGLRKDLTEERATQAIRWEKHEQEHHKFEEQLMALEKRLSHLEGEHAFRWRHEAIMAPKENP